uniref:Uncharacterized protein n=1 Tax=Caenorhabditis japonica TaxID=281687 RepID=A0A8R1EMT0_CAEJA
MSSNQLTMRRLLSICVFFFLIFATLAQVLDKFGCYETTTCSTEECKVGFKTLREIVCSATQYTRTCCFVTGPF